MSASEADGIKFQGLEGSVVIKRRRKGTELTCEPNSFCRRVGNGWRLFGTRKEENS